MNIICDIIMKSRIFIFLFFLIGINSGSLGMEEVPRIFNIEYYEKNKGVDPGELISHKWAEGFLKENIQKIKDTADLIVSYQYNLIKGVLSRETNLDDSLLSLQELGKFSPDIHKTYQKTTPTAYLFREVK